MQFRDLLLIAIFVFLTTSTGVHSGEYKQTKGYYIENEKFLNWSEAFEFCKTKHMTLFSVRDKEEFDFLKTIITQRYNRTLPYWLGAHRIDGVYMWLPSGDIIKNFMWHVGEPNDKSGHENCIHTWDNDFDWNDNDCERKLPFICEVEADQYPN